MNSQLSATLRSQIRNRSGKLAGKNIRNYRQLTGPVSATNTNIIEAIELNLSRKWEYAFDNSDSIDGKRSKQAVHCTRNSTDVQSTCNAERCNPAGMPVRHGLTGAYKSIFIKAKIARSCNSHAIDTQFHRQSS